MLFPVMFVFVRYVIKLEELRHWVASLVKEGKSQQFVDEIPYLRRELKTVFQFLKAEAERMQLTKTLSRLQNYKVQVFFSDGAISITKVEKLGWELEELADAIDADLTLRLFCVLEKDEVDHFYHPNFNPKTKQPFFGKKVDRQFKSTRNDVTETANCYAFARYTACVFHAMRVVEKGLHAFVRHLNAKHNAGINFGKKVEEEQWGRITEEIQIAIESPKRLKRLNPVPTREEMRFYATAAKEFEYFNEAWRKDVSHSRKSYDKTSALSVMEHVRKFMQILADNKLKE